MTDDVGRDAVVPRGAGRELERHAGQSLDQRLEALRLEGVEAKAAIRGVDVGPVLEPVGQARRVAHQVDHSHRRIDGPHDEGAGLPGAVHGLLAPRRDPAGDRVVERDPPFLGEHHEGDARDRLGHRVDAKDRVLLEALLLRERGVAEHAPVDELALPRHEQQRARQQARLDVALGEETVDASQARRRRSRAQRGGRGGASLSWASTGCPAGGTRRPAFRRAAAHRATGSRPRPSRARGARLPAPPRAG